MFGPAHRSAQAGFQAGMVPEAAGLRAGPDRGQAGLKSEAAGLVAGPDRCQAGQAPEPAGLLAGQAGAQAGLTGTAMTATEAR